jgi:hypothetical protein
MQFLVCSAITQKGGCDDNYGKTLYNIYYYVGANGVRLLKLEAPISESDWNERHFGEINGAFNRIDNFRGVLPAEPDVSVLITDCHERFEACPLPGRRLLLHGHDVHDLVL